MKPWCTVALLLLSRITAVAGVDVILNQKEGQKCSGMYSRKAWGGQVEPFILVKFVNNGERNKGIEDPAVGLVIWEWKDTLLLGKPNDVGINEVGCSMGHVQ